MPNAKKHHKGGKSNRGGPSRRNRDDGNRGNRPDNAAAGPSRRSSTSSNTSASTSSSTKTSSPPKNGVENATNSDASNSSPLSEADFQKSEESSPARSDATETGSQQAEESNPESELSPLSSPSPDENNPDQNNPAPNAPKPSPNEPTQWEDGPKQSLVPQYELQVPWTLWFFRNDKSLDWKDNQAEIQTVVYVETFWALYNHILRASELKAGNDYSLFQKGILPMWEDPVNKNGGRWMINLDKRMRETDLDNAWRDILLLLIGHTLDYHDQICGATVNIRFKGNKIGVWTKDCTNSAAIMEIGHKIKEALNIPQSVLLKYEAHVDSIHNKNAPARYTV